MNDIKVIVTIGFGGLNIVAVEITGIVSAKDLRDAIDVINREEKFILTVAENRNVEGVNFDA